MMMFGRPETLAELASWSQYDCAMAVSRQLRRMSGAQDALNERGQASNDLLSIPRLIMSRTLYDNFTFELEGRTGLMIASQACQGCSGHRPQMTPSTQKPPAAALTEILVPEDTSNRHGGREEIGA